MKNKKLYIFLIVVLLIYSIVMLVLFNKKDNGSGYKYLILDNNAIFRYSNGSFEEIDNSMIEKFDIKFKAYSDNKYLGKYTLKYGATWNLFDSKNSFVKYDGYLFAYSDNFNIEKINVVSRELSSNDKTFLYEKYGISNYNSILINKVYDIDINNDKDLDEIICISNIDNDNINTNYNIVVVKTNNSYSTLIEQKGKKVTDVYNIKAFFKKDGLASNYFVLENINGYESDSQTVTDTIYKYDNNKFTKIISN